MAEYRDPTPISPREPEYDKTKVSKEVANYSKQVREKIKGHDVREALARNSEIADIKAEDAVATSYDTKARQDDVENRFDDQIAGNTDIDEVIDARRPEGGESYPTLRKRLDDEHKEVTTQLAQTMINVKSFGAIGDGIADDTNSIQEAINHASLIDNVFVYIPEGTYMIKAHVDEVKTSDYLRDEGGVELLDNIKLLLHGKAVLKAIPNDKKQYNILRIYNKTNVQVEGGNIEGERISHTGTGGEWGYGIAITGGSNISIKNMNIYDCWGDGINTQVYDDGMHTISPDKIYIDNVISNNNRRQGLSIEALTNGIIKNSTFKNTNGTQPSAGIDIEPWSANNIVENVVIDNCIFEGNSGLGLILHGHSVLNIKVKDCYFDDNKSVEGDISCLWGSDVTFENNVLSSGIKFTDYKNIKMINNKTTSIILSNVENVIIKDNHIYKKSISNILYQVAITIEHKTSSIVEKNKNITVIDNVLNGIYDGRTPSGNVFMFTNINKENTKKIKIKDNTIKDFYRVLNMGINKEITAVEFIHNHLINIGNGLEINGDNWLVTNNIFEGVPNKDTTTFPIVLRSKNKNSFVANNVVYKEPRLETDVLSGFTYYATVSSNEGGNETNTNLNNTFIDNSL